MRIIDWSSDVCSSDLDPAGDDPWAVWTVETESGERYEAPAVILSAGGTPYTLGVPGEEEFAGRGVSFCARSGERSVGKEGVSMCRSRRVTFNSSKKYTDIIINLL